VNHKRVELIWRREVLKVPVRQPRRGRLWHAYGSCIRLRPERPGHVWAYDFVEDRTHDGRKFRILTVIDEYIRECLAPPVGYQRRSDDVLSTLTDLFITHGPSEYIRSDQGSEFVANLVKDWLGRIGVRTLYIEKLSPWEIAYNESFNGNAMSCLTGRYSTPWRSPEFCLKPGGTTTPNARTARSAIDRRSQLQGGPPTPLRSAGGPPWHQEAQ
jgi:transposase InsO family protein